MTGRQFSAQPPTPCTRTIGSRSVPPSSTRTRVRRPSTVLVRGSISGYPAPHMLFYYLCTVGEKLHREAYPQGAQSKDADVYKWVLLHSGSPAVCQREHPAEHRWRPDEGGDEERVVRSYAVLQWDKEGFDFAKTKPDVGERFDSRWGPSLVVERSDDPTTGTYLLLRIFPHGYGGKPGSLASSGTTRPGSSPAKSDLADVPTVLDVVHMLVCILGNPRWIEE